MTELLNSRIEAEMLESYTEQTAALLDNVDAYTKDPDDCLKLGIEVECSVINSDGAPITDEMLRNLIIDGDPRYTQELGAGQIEIISPPLDVMQSSGLEVIHSFLEESIADLRGRTTQLGGRILLSGTNPLVAVDDIIRTDSPKYSIVPDFYNAARNGHPRVIGPNSTYVAEAAIPSILNSIQPNFEARSIPDAVDKLNRLVMIGPMATALTANARYLGLQDSGMADLRVPAWRTAFDIRNNDARTHGTEPRVGTPNRYYDGIEDYFSRIAKYPFILDTPEQAMQVGIGMNWKDAKIKFMGSSAVVEFRPMSTQPTAEENTAAVLFVAGRLFYSQMTNEDLTPIELVHQNTREAVHRGHEGHLWSTDDNGLYIQAKATEVLERELLKATQGLAMSEMPNISWANEQIEGLRRNLKEGTPSSRLGKMVEGISGDMRMRLLEGLVRVKAVDNLKI